MAPLLPFFLAYVAGISAALPASRNFLPLFGVPLAAAGAAFFLAAELKKFKRGRNVRWALLGGFLIFGFLAPGLPQYFMPENHVLRHLKEGEPAGATGRIVEVLEASSTRARYVVELTEIRYGETAIPVSGRARISQYSPKNFLRPGDVARISKARLKRPRNFKNPGRFDYKRYLEKQGIRVIGNISKSGSIQKIGTFPLPPFAALRNGVRDKMSAVIGAYFTKDEGALARAMVLGDKQALSEEMKEAFRATGLAHLTAVSGLHIGFAAFASYFLSYPLIFYFLCKYFPEAARAGGARKTAVIFTLGPVLFYVALVGAKVSALRAGTMVFIFLLAVLLNRGGNLFNALLLAAFLLLLWTPQAILDAGFQLSFMAVFSILFVLHFLGKREEDDIDRMGEFSARLRIWKFLRGTALITLAANLGTLLILAFHFNRVSLVGFFLNLLAVPVAAVLIPATLLALTLGLIWQPATAAFMPVISLLLKFFLIVPPFFASLPYAAAYIPTPPRLWFILYYGAFFGAGYWFH
ncbi:MAG: ComEC/Rec2 family competence protein, partial [Nitrospinales bacterium]